LDILTALMIWTVEVTTLAALLISRWCYDRENFYLTWGTGLLLHGLGSFLVLARGTIPDFLSIEIANTMVLTGMGLLAGGMMQFDRRRIEPYILIPALMWIAGMFLTPVRESLANRIVLHNLANMMALAMMIHLLVKPKSVLISTRHVLAALFALPFIFNAVVAAVCLRYEPFSLPMQTTASWLFVPASATFIGCIVMGAKMLTDRTADKLKQLAVTDPLTGALNRRGLIDEFSDLRIVDNGEKPLIALLHFDLDSFKEINDRCGHQAGDAVLVGFAEIGMVALRDRGMFGRIGGEEFASILRVSDMIEAAIIAEAIRTTLKRRTISIGEHQVSVTVSTGISLAPAYSADLDMLLNSADKALYFAKENGRDRTAISGEEILIVPAIDHLQEEELRLDLRGNRHMAALTRLVATIPR